MSGIMCSLVGGSGFFPLSMVVGYRTVARNDNSFYGYEQLVIGTITPSSNNFPPNSTQTISDLYYLNAANAYYLYLTSTATNSGWISATINGLTLLRTSATFATGGWTWAAPDSGAALTGAVGSTVKVTFS